MSRSEAHKRASPAGIRNFLPTRICSCYGQRMRIFSDRLRKLSGLSVLGRRFQIGSVFRRTLSGASRAPLLNEDFWREVEEVSFDGPSLPPDFSRRDIYTVND